MPYHFRNLVFEGGGVKGIAYIGALAALGRRGILKDIVRVGGTSAGAINALLFALGYSHAETKHLLAELDFTSFLDDDWGVLRDTDRLLHQFGWYRGARSTTGCALALPTSLATNVPPSTICRRPVGRICMCMAPT